MGGVGGGVTSLYGANQTTKTERRARDGKREETLESKETRSVSARINIKMSPRLIPSFLGRESDLCGFYVYTDHLFFLNCHCEGAVIKRLSQRHQRTLPVT